VARAPSSGRVAPEQEQGPGERRNRGGGEQGAHDVGGHPWSFEPVADVGQVGDAVGVAGPVELVVERDVDAEGHSTERRSTERLRSGGPFPARWIVSRQPQQAAAERAPTCRDVGLLCLQAVAGIMRIVPSNPSVSAFTSCPASWTWAPSRNPSTTVPSMTTDPVTLLSTPLR
jgi:hypothetical protein